MTIEPGTTTNGAVVRVTDYGAIVRLDCGKMGLVHISEIADAYVRDVRDYLNEGDRIAVKVLRENDKGRYELSIKRCDASPPAREPAPCEPAMAVAAVGITRGAPAPIPTKPDLSADSYRFFSHRPAPSPRLTFEDQLSRFFKDSEERQHELRRHQDIKRGRR